MEENNTSAKLSEISDFEERFALWKQRYQQHLEMMKLFYQWQEGYHSQLVHHHEKLQMLQDMREDLVREMQERKYRRATRPPFYK
jgi:hypothetical protein